MLCGSYLVPYQKDEQKMRTRFKEVEVEATRAEMGIRSMKHLTDKVQRTAAINKQIYRVDERQAHGDTGHNHPTTPSR